MEINCVALITKVQVMEFLKEGNFEVHDVRSTGRIQLKSYCNKELVIIKEYVQSFKLMNGIAKYFIALKYANGEVIKDSIHQFDDVMRF